MRWWKQQGFALYILSRKQRKYYEESNSIASHVCVWVCVCVSVGVLFLVVILKLKISYKRRRKVHSTQRVQKKEAHIAWKPRSSSFPKQTRAILHFVFALFCRPLSIYCYYIAGILGFSAFCVLWILLWHFWCWYMYVWENGYMRTLYK